MIRGNCRTNIDDYKREEWPSYFAFPPRIGDSVQARSGKKLRVVQVTHCFDDRGAPQIEVELHR